MARVWTSPGQSGAREEDYPIAKMLRRLRESQVILGEDQRQAGRDTQAMEQLKTALNCRSLVT